MGPLGRIGSICASQPLAAPAVNGRHGTVICDDGTLGAVRTGAEERDPGASRGGWLPRLLAPAVVVLVVCGMTLAGARLDAGPSVALATADALASPSTAAVTAAPIASAPPRQPAPSVPAAAPTVRQASPTPADAAPSEAPAAAPATTEPAPPEHGDRQGAPDLAAADEGLPLSRPGDEGAGYPPAPATAVDAGDRTAWWTGHGPMGSFEGLTLHHPAEVVELIGLHQSNHEGARDLQPVQGAAAWQVMESRGRLSGLQSAADVVVQPGTAILAPVTGTVLRAGSYTLYCDLRDEYVVIEPDGMPGFEVKVLHIVGVQVAPGDRVEAGATVIAGEAHLLPFRSQVDALTAEPSWPHTHIEVVDTAIPNQPNGGSGSSC